MDALLVGAGVSEAKKVLLCQPPAKGDQKGVTRHRANAVHVIQRVLSVWLSRNGKSPKEPALKVRLRELLRGG